MSIRNDFEQVLTHYASARTGPLKGHPIAKLLRDTIPGELGSILEATGNYEIQGSPGQGQWGNVPWVAIFDPLVTTTARRGFYPVYLFSEDLTGVYLSLNQGVTDVRDAFPLGKVREVLESRAKQYRAVLSAIPSSFSAKPIDLEHSPNSDLARDYEYGNIISVYYPAKALPTNEVFSRDLLAILIAYQQVIQSQNTAAAISSPEDDESGTSSIEDLTVLRQHKRIERNRTLAEKVKKLQGYRCKACGFVFSDAYPGIANAKYIEAHHLVPIFELKGQKVSLSPAKDFAVLCANCHRMIHRFEKPHDVEAFKKTLKA